MRWLCLRRSKSKFFITPAGTTWLNFVMIVALLVLIPGGAGLWYTGSLKNKSSLKIAGIALQVRTETFVVIFFCSQACDLFNFQV